MGKQQRWVIQKMLDDGSEGYLLVRVMAPPLNEATLVKRPPRVSHLFGEYQK